MTALILQKACLVSTESFCFMLGYREAPNFSSRIRINLTFANYWMFSFAFPLGGPVSIFTEI